MAVESKKREMTTETKSSLTPKDQLPAKLQAQLGLFIRDLSDEFGKDPEIQKKLEEIAQKIQTSDPLLVMIIFSAQIKPYLHLIEKNEVESLVKIVLNLGGSIAAKMNDQMTTESREQILKWIKFLVKIAQNYSQP